MYAKMSWGKIKIRSILDQQRNRRPTLYNKLIKCKMEDKKVFGKITIYYDLSYKNNIKLKLNYFCFV